VRALPTALGQVPGVQHPLTDLAQRVPARRCPAERSSSAPRGIDNACRAVHNSSRVSPSSWPFTFPARADTCRSLTCAVRPPAHRTRPDPARDQIQGEHRQLGRSVGAGLFGESLLGRGPHLRFQ
jgi:hypothetical protein